MRDGITTNFILRDIKKKFNIYALDPVPSYLKSYKKHFPKAKTFLTTWQDFDIQKKFDMIFAINALYGIPPTKENKEHYEKFLKMLKPGGEALILMLTEKSSIVSFAKKYWFKVHQMPYIRNYYEKTVRKLKEWFPKNLKEERIEKIASMDIPFKDALTITGFFLYLDRELILRYKIPLPDFTCFKMRYGLAVLKK